MSAVNLAKLSKSAKAMVALGLECGWLAKNTANGGVLLEVQHDSGGRQTISIPRQSNLNEQKRMSWEAKILRYGQPLMVAAWQAKLNQATETMARTHGDADTVVARMVDQDSPMHAIERSDTINGEYAPPAVEKLKPTVVSSRPWMAARGTGPEESRRYESPTTLERRWSDGAVDYACVIESCEFTDPVPQRVARHYSRSNKETHPPTEQPKETYAAEPYTPGVGKKTARIERLAAELKAALAGMHSFGSYDSPEEYMTELAKVIITRRDTDGGRGEVEPEPLTAEQVVERVRRLVDDGSYLRRIETEREQEIEIAAMKQRIEAQEESMDRLSALVAQTEAERDAAQERWDALTSLITETKEKSNAEA